MMFIKLASLAFLAFESDSSYLESPACSPAPLLAAVTPATAYQAAKVRICAPCAILIAVMTLDFTHT
jgi:hypothetical protein